MRPWTFILLALAAASCIGPDGKPRPVTPEDVEAARRIACAADPRLCATPTPEPTRTPVCCDPTPAPSASPAPPSPTATPTPSPTPVNPGTPTPSATPTSAPPPSPTPFCVQRPGPAPVTLAYRGRCPRGMRELDFAGECSNYPPPGYDRLCAVDVGTGNAATPWRLGFGLGRQGCGDDAMKLRNFNGAWLQFNPGRDCTDALGRHFVGADCQMLYANSQDGDRSPWTWGGYEVPTFCEDRPVPPTPAPTAGTPGPTAPPPTGPAQGFRLNITNVSNSCRGFGERNGDCWCTPDGAHRYVGVLKDGRVFGNTVDRDHWVCAVEPCVKDADKTDAEWAEILKAHRDTYELGGGDEWIVSTGIRHEWRYAGDQGWNVADRQANPYMGEFHATCGAAVQARGCMDEGAYSCPDAYRGEKKDDGTNYSEWDCKPEHHRPVPGAGGCGPVKSYEVKR